MDWIKVLNRHILLEYSDLRDSEFAAWIKIMALTASLEQEPTREQILKYVHYKTLTSLQDKLNKHSIDLQYILNKVLIDVQYVSNRRESLKQNTQRYRDKHKLVIDDVIVTSLIREDKIREDKNKSILKEEHVPLFEDEPEPPKKKTIPPALDDVKAYCQERKNNIDPEAFISFYESNGWMVGKNKMRDWKAAVITWEKRGGNGNGKRTSLPYQGAKGRVDAGERDVRDYQPDEMPTETEEQRQANLKKIREFTSGIGRASP